MNKKDTLRILDMAIKQVILLTRIRVAEEERAHLMTVQAQALESDLTTLKEMVESKK